MSDLKRVAGAGPGTAGMAKDGRRRTCRWSTADMRDFTWGDARPARRASIATAERPRGRAFASAQSTVPARIGAERCGAPSSVLDAGRVAGIDGRPEVRPRLHPRETLGGFRPTRASRRRLCTAPRRRRSRGPPGGRKASLFTPDARFGRSHRQRTIFRVETPCRSIIAQHVPFGPIRVILQALHGAPAANNHPTADVDDGARDEDSRGKAVG